METIRTILSDYATEEHKVIDLVLKAKRGEVEMDAAEAAINDPSLAAISIDEIPRGVLLEDTPMAGMSSEHGFGRMQMAYAVQGEDRNYILMRDPRNPERIGFFAEDRNCPGSPVIPNGIDEIIEIYGLNSKPKF